MLISHVMRSPDLPAVRQIVAAGLILLALTACGGGGGEEGDGPTQNRPPVAGPDSATTLEGQPVTVNVLANDSDPEGDVLTVSVSVPADFGTGVVNAGGTITITPTDEVLGSDYPLTYTLTDAGGLTATGSVRLSVALKRPLLYVADEDAANVFALYLGDVVARRRISHVLAAGEQVLDFQVTAARPVAVYSTGTTHPHALHLRGLADNAPDAVRVSNPLPAGADIHSWRLSPSGMRVAFVTRDTDNIPQLHVAALGTPVSVAAVPIATAANDQIYSITFGGDESDLYFTMQRRVGGVWQSAIYRARGAAPTSIEPMTGIVQDPLSIGEFVLRPLDVGLVYRGNTANGPQLLRVDFGVPGSEAVVNEPFTTTPAPGEVRSVVQFAIASDGNQVPHIVNADRQDSFVSFLSQPGSARRLNPTVDVSQVGSFLMAPNTQRMLLRVGVVSQGFQIGLVDLSSNGAMSYLTQTDIISGSALAPGGQHAAVTTESIVQLIYLQSTPYQRRNLEASAQRAFEPRFSEGGRVLAFLDAVDASLAVRRLRVANYAELTPTRKWTGFDVSVRTPSRGVQSFAFAPLRPY